MLKLLQNEFVKIFKKKSIFVIFVIMIFFVVATNIIYKYKINELGEFNNNKYNYLKIAEYEYENSNDDKVKSLSKFVLDTKYNINRKNDLRGILLNLFVEYDIFIILISVLIPGVIISEEFHNGTIKQLLITPNSRFKIMLSKLLTCFLMIVSTIFILVILQLFIGSLFFPISGLSVPVAIYNYHTSSVVTYNIFSYLLILILNKMPMFIIMSIIILFINTISLNSAVSVLIGLLLYVLSPILNALSKNIKIFNLFVTPHWDLSIYMFNNLNGLSVSIITDVIYVVVLIFITFYVFMRKDIKNV